MFMACHVVRTAPKQEELLAASRRRALASSPRILPLRVRALCAPVPCSRKQRLEAGSLHSPPPLRANGSSSSSDRLMAQPAAPASRPSNRALASAPV